MTKADRNCPRCGLVFTSAKLEGLCPACLLGGLFAGEGGEDTGTFWENDTERAVDSLFAQTENSGEGGAPAAACGKAPPARRFSHFEILEELGRGGMGIVYRARDLGTGRIVALKVLQAHHLEVPDLVQRFRSEVRAVTSLDHPHVLPVHEVGEYEGIPFFSMKLTTGGSLAQRLGDFLGKPKELARLMAKVARGVAHAHERGILHRDLKPGNILLDAAGEPFVCDFGLAKWIEDDRNLTITAAVLGTPHYIAPEQASGQRGLTTAADLYSLGAILYELLTARPPFVGTSIIETLRLSSEQTPERPSSLAQNIPRDLETICLKCLQREPAARYPSAAALAADLENWLDGRPIHARPVSSGEQLWRWAKRNPLPAALAASVAILVAATAVVATVSAVRIDKARARAVAAEEIAKREEASAREKLYEARLAQARASLLTGQAGHSLNALEALMEAQKIHPSDEVRNLAIRALSLTDLELIEPEFKIGPNSRPTRSFDSTLTHIAEEVEKGVVRILRLHPGTEGTIVAELHETDTPASIDKILHSPDDTALAARHGDGRLRVWDLATRKKRFELPTAVIPKAPWYAPNFVFSHDGSRLACARAEGGIAVHDAQTGAEFFALPATGLIRCASFSPDGTRLALATYDTTQLAIWDLARREVALALELPSPAYSVAWSPNGRELAAGAFDGALYLYETRRGRRTGTFTGHRQEVTQVLFTPAGDRLISTSLDKTVRLWSLSALTQEVMLPNLGSEAALRFSADGKRLAATSAGPIAHFLHIHDASQIVRTAVNSRPIARATLVGGIAFSPSGRLIATATYEGIDLWDASTGRSLAVVDIEPDQLKSVRFFGDDTTLVVGSPESGVVQYSLTELDGELSLQRGRTIDAEKDFIFSNSPPGDRDLLGMTSQTKGIARVISLSDGQEKLRITNLKHVWDVGISPDQTLIALSFAQAAGRDGNTQIWSLKTKEGIATLSGGQHGVARFSHDSRRLKISGQGDTDYLWVAPTWWQDLAKQCAGASPAFHPTHERFATVQSSFVKIWDKSKTPSFIVESPLLLGSGLRLSFSPDGDFLAALSANNLLVLWNLRVLEDTLRKLGFDSMNTTRTSP
jgi:WD40 repeat protein